MENVTLQFADGMVLVAEIEEKLQQNLQVEI
jgi:hypothetical protein